MSLGFKVQRVESTGELKQLVERGYVRWCVEKGCLRKCFKIRGVSGHFWIG